MASLFYGVLAPTYQKREPALAILYYLENGHADTLKESLNLYLEDFRFQRLSEAIASSAKGLRDTVLNAFQQVTMELERQGNELRGEISDYCSDALVHAKGIENSVRTLEYYETMKMLNGYYG